MPPEIIRLTVVYDDRCDLCVRARAWLESQPRFVPLAFVGARSAAARELVPAIPVDDLLRDLTVVSDRGDVWRGPPAWVTCLWALKRYRAWSYRFADPALLPLVRRAIEAISGNRMRLGEFVRARGPRMGRP